MNASAYPIGGSFLMSVRELIGTDVGEIRLDGSMVRRSSFPGLVTIPIGLLWRSGMNRASHERKTMMYWCASSFARDRKS